MKSSPVTHSRWLYEVSWLAENQNFMIERLFGELDSNTCGDDVKPISRVQLSQTYWNLRSSSEIFLIQPWTFVTQTGETKWLEIFHNFWQFSLRLMSQSFIIRPEMIKLWEHLASSTSRKVTKRDFFSHLRNVLAVTLTQVLIIKNNTGRWRDSFFAKSGLEFMATRT